MWLGTAAAMRFLVSFNESGHCGPKKKTKKKKENAHHKSNLLLERVINIPRQIFSFQKHHVLIVSFILPINKTFLFLPYRIIPYHGIICTYKKKTGRINLQTW